MQCIVESPASGRPLVEGKLPLRLEVDGIDQHQPSVTVEHTWLKEVFLNLFIRRFPDPSVDLIDRSLTLCKVDLPNIRKEIPNFYETLNFLPISHSLLYFLIVMVFGF